MIKDMIMDNASDILFGVGIGGLGVTIAACVKGTKGYISDEDPPTTYGMTFGQKVKKIAKHYGGTVAAVVVTVLGFGFSKAIDSAEIAGLSAGLAAAVASRNKILDKSKELYGEDTPEKIQDEVMKDDLAKTDIQKYHPNDDEIICYWPEEFGGGYFVTTRYKVLEAFYNLNLGLNDNFGYYYHSCTVYELLAAIDIYDQLPNKEMARICGFGWDSCKMWEDYESACVDFDIPQEPTMVIDGKEVYRISVTISPEALD